jgi:1-acyl-sn-glycerol-3-phosphate acyltransferase
MGWAVRTFAAVLRPLLLVLTRRDWQFPTRIPATGGVLVVANHISNADPGGLGWFVLSGAGRVPRFMGKASLWKVPVLRAFLRGGRMIPVHRGSEDAAGALTHALEALRRGECVVIYPEGTVTKDPEMWPMRARTGVARLALATGVPVVPVGQWGMHRFLGADGLHLFRRPRTHLVAGPPVDLSRYAGVTPDAAVLREVTELIMSRVTALVSELRGEPAPPTAFDPRADRPAGRADTA